MALFINRALFRTETFQSDALGVLGVIIHPLELGLHRATVLRGDVVAGAFTVSVGDPGGEPAAAVDLHAVTGAPTPETFTVTPGAEGEAFLQLYVSEGSALFNVRLESEATEGKPGPEFDSRRLGAGDLYALTLLRPGEYDMRHPAGAAGRITVSEADRGAPYAPDSAALRVTADAFEPAEVQLRAGDGVVFGFEAPGAVQVALRTTDGGKEKPGPRRIVSAAGHRAAAAERSDRPDQAAS